ncbi:MAG TPA: hypothetical protein VLJ76_09950 [Gaiellaceae bacterium]|nr:hypothetical protein [Gaiellaceae bacterium]
MKPLLFLHVLAATVLVGALIAAAVGSQARDERVRGIVRGSAIAALAATIVTVGLGEGLAANEHAGGGWLDASRGLALFGLLLGSAALAVMTGRTLGRGRVVATTAVALSIIGLVTAFVMAAKP